MALHEQCVGATDEWYTPKHVFDALGCAFTMDVASPNPPVPWIPTSRYLWSDSLDQEWDGFIWMNAPFGARNGIVPWLEKFFAHGNGIALTPDRTSAPWWQRFSNQAHKVLFISPKLKFIGADGLPGTSPAQGTSLMAVGSRGVAALHRATDNGLGVLMAVQPTVSISSPTGNSK
jgi:DNA N-6-adenine-methyltransferase Dam